MSETDKLIEELRSLKGLNRVGAWIDFYLQLFGWAWETRSGSAHVDHIRW